MDTNDFQTEIGASDPKSLVPKLELGNEDVTAWEEIAAGRYMPRRIRGSCRGRVLG
jgi:hypothetical protein